MKRIEVVAAIIMDQDMILCVQRGANRHPYISEKFEFPGGKVEEGETQENALVREIKEELDMDIIVNNFFLTVEHAYPDFSLIMHSFICFAKNNSVTLTEHIAYQWLNKDNLLGLDWAAADIPIVDKLRHS